MFLGRLTKLFSGLIYLELTVTRGSIRSFSIPPSPSPGQLNPRAFDCLPYPGSREFETKALPWGREFEPCLGGVENLVVPGMEKLKGKEVAFVKPEFI